MTAIPQHMLALANANEKRLAMAEFRRSVRSLSTQAAADLVADMIENEHDDDMLGGFRINTLLMSVPWLGQTKVSKCLSLAGVRTFDKRLRDLTPRQRKATALQLRIWAAGYGR